jgi:hypothetical protein
MISLLHPTRSRPDISLSTCKKWIERAGTDNIQLIISIDSDEQRFEEYEKNHAQLSGMLNNGFMTRTILLVGNNHSAIEAINHAAKVASGDILMVVSDDTDCPENWAIDLLKHLEGKSDFVVKCPDGIQDWMITMPVMDRKYYQRFGYIYHPEYIHMFCDLEVACVGDLLARTINVPMMFRHDHYNAYFENDPLRKKTNETWQQGEEVFIRRIKNNFDLPADQIVGKITNEGYRAWIQTKVK